MTTTTAALSCGTTVYASPCLDTASLGVLQHILLVLRSKPAAAGPSLSEAKGTYWGPIYTGLLDLQGPSKGYNYDPLKSLWCIYADIKY